MEIREIHREELETLVDSLWTPFVEEMAALDSYNALADDIRDDQLEYKREQFDDESVVIYVAETDDVLGYALAEHGETPPVFQRGSEVNIEELYVAPSARNRGVASALMEQIEQWAADQGAARMTLSVNQANEPALCLYRALGFGIRRHKMDKPVGDRSRETIDR